MIDEVFRLIESRLLIAGERKHKSGDVDCYCQIGSGCLILILYNKDLFIANVGKSRAVIGRTRKQGFLKRNIIVAEQITNDHDIDLENEREALERVDPNSIVTDPDGKALVKGVTKLTRTMGYICLKCPEMARHHLEHDMRKPLLSAAPEMWVRRIESDDQFVVLASPGLWEQLTNEEVVDFIKKRPRHEGIAKELIYEALKVAAKRKLQNATEMEAREGLPPNDEDIIVMVILFNSDKLQRQPTGLQDLSFKAFYENEESILKNLRGSAQTTLNPNVPLSEDAKRFDEERARRKKDQAGSSRGYPSSLINPKRVG